MVLFLRGGAQFSPRYFDDRELAYLAKYIIKRVAMGLLCIFIVATLTFLLMNLVPGGPFIAEKSMSEAAQEADTQRPPKGMGMGLLLHRC